MTRTTTALAAGFALAVQPLLVSFAHAQQDLDAPQTLEDLIPDEAVRDPEAWAQQGAPDEVSGPDGEAVTDLAADSPMEPMPLLTLEAPEDIELAEIEPVEPEDDIEFATFDDVIPPLPAGSEERLSDELILVFPSETSLFPERDEFLARFEMLSTIEEYDDDGNLARLAAQARADEELLIRMLRTYGYFDGQVIRSVGNVEETTQANLDRPAVRFDVLPGMRYTVGAVDLGQLAEAGDDYDALRAAYEIQPGDLLSLDDIENERIDLDAMLGETGYPFAELDDPSLLVDHERAEGDVTQPVRPNGKYVMGAVTSNLEDFLSGRHLADIARFDRGDIYQRSDELDLRRAILATGLVGSVSLTPVEVTPPTATEPGTVDIAVQMTQAPLRTIAGNIGYGSEEGIRVEASWEHRNLFPPEGLLRVRAIAGTQEQLAGVTFRKNNFRGRDRILTIDAFASTIDYDFYDAETVSLVGNYERVSNLLFQKPFSYGVGVELVATRQAEIDEATGIQSPTQTYFIAAVPAFAQIDTSDDLLNPTEGVRLRGAISPEVSRVNDSNGFYIKSQFDLSYYQEVTDRVVLAGRARAGTIQGAEITTIAPSRRFYAGGGGSVRGYGYRSIGPRDGVGQPNGGRSLLELSAEARVQTGFLDGAIQVVPFVDAGVVDRSTVPSFDDIRVGVGLGVRYLTGFGPIRLDVGVPLNPGPNDGPVAVYVALGQAF